MKKSVSGEPSSNLGVVKVLVTDIQPMNTEVIRDWFSVCQPFQNEQEMKDRAQTFRYLGAVISFGIAEHRSGKQEYRVAIAAPDPATRDVVIMPFWRVIGLDQKPRIYRGFNGALNLDTTTYVWPRPRQPLKNVA